MWKKGIRVIVSFVVVLLVWQIACTVTNAKFDASNMEYLEILIKYGIRFNETDMNSALEIYEKYETKLNQKIAEQSKIAIGQ